MTERVYIVLVDDKPASAVFSNEDDAHDYVSLYNRLDPVAALRVYERPIFKGSRHDIGTL